MSKLSVEGIFPPLITPFEKDEISHDKLGENISKLNSFNLSGYVVLGSNGESCFLTKDEKLSLIKTVKEYAEDNKVIIAGTGLDSIKEAVSLTNDAAEVGADVALILTPSFFKGRMNHEAMMEYFNSVADRVSIPVIIYNVPKFTNVVIQPKTVQTLSKHQNIIGIKSSSTDIAYLAEVIKLVDSNFNVLAGTASILYAALFLGAKGGILAAANLLPKECINVYDLFKTKKYDEAKEIQNKLLAVNKAITATFGVAGLKKAMDWLGYYGGIPRSPLQKLSLKEEEQLKEILIEENYLNK